MPKPRNKVKKKSSSGDKLSPEEEEAAGEPNKLELPDPETVVAETTFVSPKGNKYQIIKTVERDEYEEVKAESKRRRQRNPPDD